MSLERRLGLKEGERLMTVAHGTVVAALPLLTLSAALIGTAIYFRGPLLDLETIGRIILGTDLALGLLLGLGQLVRWRGSYLALTDCRLFVVRRAGFFDRRVLELPLSKIRSVSHRVAGLLATIFGYGTLSLDVVGTDASLTVPRLPRPDRLQASIADLQLSKDAEDISAMLRAVPRLSDEQLDLLAAEVARQRRYRAAPPPGDYEVEIDAPPQV